MIFKVLKKKRIFLIVSKIEKACSIFENISKNRTGFAYTMYFFQPAFSLPLRLLFPPSASCKEVIYVHLEGLQLH